MLIALTGGIASGKSTVAEIWHELGAEVIDADDIARQVVLPGSAGLIKLRERFGDSILDSQGELDRAALGNRIFSDPAARHDLEHILHPLISAESKRRFAESGSRHVVYAIPLLVEAGGEYEFDKICAVSAPADVRLERLVEYRKLTKAQALARIAAQASDAEREAVADEVIDSNCSLPELRDRARAAWSKLTSEKGDPIGT